MNREGITQQLQRHFVAILSLVIAIIALGYTTWREEATEQNRNTRTAAFEVLKNLGELQVIVNLAAYPQPNFPFNPLVGWGHVAIISDMGSLLPEPIPKLTEELVKMWGDNWQKLQANEAAQDTVTAEIDTNRKAVLEVIHKLR